LVGPVWSLVPQGVQPNVIAVGSRVTREIFRDRPEGKKVERERRERREERREREREREMKCET